jgi:ubiquitin-like 1-activating enzyme E1 A
MAAVQALNRFETVAFSDILDPDFSNPAFCQTNAFIAFTGISVFVSGTFLKRAEMTQQDLSKNESAIYDRQIRLWGSNAQLRIKSSTVLIIGLTRTSTEIAKNTVLAGTNLILEDDRSVKEDTRNFLIALEISDPSGMSVGEATAVAARRLNEHPRVTCMPASESRSEKTLSDVQAVVCSLQYLGMDLAEALRLSSLCRSHGVGFFLLFDCAAASWMFSDYGASHIVESHTAPLKRDERTGDRKADSKVEEFAFTDLSGFIGSDIESNVANPKASFPRSEILFVRFMLEWLKLSCAAEPSPKRTRRSASPSRRAQADSSFSDFVFQRMAELSQSPGRVGKMLSNSVTDLVDSLVAKESIMGIEVEPYVAAIHGALVAQEIIKFVTKRDVPLVNQIIMHPGDCAAVVVKTPMALSSRVISGDEPDEDDVELVNGSSVVAL